MERISSAGPSQTTGPSFAKDHVRPDPKSEGAMVDRYSPAYTPAAVFVRTEIQSGQPHVYTDKGGVVHFQAGQGTETEIRVFIPSVDPMTPLKAVRQGTTTGQIERTGQ